MCLGTFSRLARSLATIYIFARVRIFGTSVPFFVTGNFSEFPVNRVGGWLLNSQPTSHRTVRTGPVHGSSPVYAATDLR